MVRSRRELVGVGPTLLGVQSTWTGNDVTVETVAGGYVDDLTESYDDLRTVGTRDLSGGSTAEVLAGQLLGESVLVVAWRDASQEVPCDVHALVITGADVAVQTELLRGLR